jgi:hypothetical protein
VWLKHLRHETSFCGSGRERKVNGREIDCGIPACGFCKLCGNCCGHISAGFEHRWCLTDALNCLGSMLFDSVGVRATASIFQEHFHDRPCWQLRSCERKQCNMCGRETGQMRKFQIFLQQNAADRMELGDKLKKFQILFSG